MLELDLPWALLVLPLPLLLWWRMPPYREQRRALRVPFFERVAWASGEEPARGSVIASRSAVQKLLAPLVWALIVLSLARPIWVEPPIERTESARDLLMVVDLSGSMDIADFTDAAGTRMRRIDAVKRVLDDFITRREGDRLGLVLFGNAAHLQVPFTLDHAVCRQLLEEAELGMVGPQTMIGEAMGLAIQLFDGSDAERRVVVLLTDGNDSGSKVPPATAARIAAERDITIHTVGIGDPDATGDDLVDVAELEGIASATGGHFFMGSDTEQLAGIYRELDAIEPTDLETLSYRPRRPLHHWPLGAAAALLASYQMLMVAVAVGRGRRREALA